jgi:Gluconate 2-dehydrogenase subunit 3
MIREDARMSKVSRRAALQALGTTAAAAALLPALSHEGVLAFTRIQTGNAPPTPKALSASDFRTLEALVEAIIPTDERSPGAKDARVADYIDLLLSEGDDELALQWMGGLAALDQEAMSRFRLPFVRLDAKQLDAVLADISKNELDPGTPLEHFFVMTKQETIRGYYSSEIGIHRELRYKGNQFLQEFVGCATEDGKDCPHCGQKSSQGGRGDRGAVHREVGEIGEAVLGSSKTT